MNTIGLAFLAPQILYAIIEARLPRGISTRAIGEPDLGWSRQWNALGIGARAAVTRTLSLPPELPAD